MALIHNSEHTRPYLKYRMQSYALISCGGVGCGGVCDGAGWGVGLPAGWGLVQWLESWYGQVVINVYTSHKGVSNMEVKTRTKSSWIGQAKTRLGTPWTSPWKLASWSLLLSTHHESDGHCQIDSTHLLRQSWLLALMLYNFPPFLNSKFMYCFKLVCVW